MAVVRFSFRPRQCLMRAGKVRAWRPSSRQLPWLTFLALMFLTGLSARPAFQPVRLLSQAEEIRRITPEEAAMPYPVRILGVVTDDVPEPDCFVQGKTAGRYVEGSQAPKFAHRVGDIVEIEDVTGRGRLQVGDEIEVRGLPEMGESAPVLADAVFHPIDHVAPPVAVKLALDSPWEQYDGARVTTEAVLLERQFQSDGIRLLLRTGEHLFEAVLHALQAERLRPVSINSQARISGVCRLRSGGLWSVPQSFRMLLRSAQDIVVMQAPSWWSLRHIMWVLSIAAGALLTVLIWAAVLGKRLRNQVVGIRQEPQNWAVLEERNRIARELHDTLEQELTAITMQLDLVADCFQHRPRAAQQALDTARSMSRHCMVEARRSVWDLRCHLLEHGDLASALERVVEPLVPQSDTRIDVRVDGRPVRLHASIEMNLLRIGQEAVANAIKHGLARNIAVELRYAPDSVRLEITDDGRGFVPDATPAGHFGLLDMRERAQCMDSWLYVESEPGMGTSISVEVPITCGQVRDEELKADTYSGR